MNYFSLIVLLFFSLLTSCSKKTEKIFTEGEIKYEILYQGEDDNLMVSFLPDEMLLKFKENKVRSTIVGSMGFFELSLIAKPKENYFLTILKMNNKNLTCEHSKETAQKIAGQDFENIQIKFKDEEKEISGFICKKALVKFPNLNSEFEFFYTDAIGGENPNVNTPFEPIKGVLLEFNMLLSGFNMKFRAKKISGTKINDTLFQMPTNHQKTSIAEIEELISF